MSRIVDDEYLNILIYTRKALTALDGLYQFVL
jgi:hypothetical protein